jgi:hypothetical protein
MDLKQSIKAGYTVVNKIHDTVHYWYTKINKNLGIAEKLGHTTLTNIYRFGTCPSTRGISFY